MQLLLFSSSLFSCGHYCLLITKIEYFPEQNLVRYFGPCLPASWVVPTLSSIVSFSLSGQIWRQEGGFPFFSYTPPGPSKLPTINGCSLECDEKLCSDFGCPNLAIPERFVVMIKLPFLSPLPLPSTIHRRGQFARRRRETKVKDD